MRIFSSLLSAISSSGERASLNDLILSLLGWFIQLLTFLRWVWGLVFFKILFPVGGKFAYEPVTGKVPFCWELQVPWDSRELVQIQKATSHWWQPSPPVPTAMATSQEGEASEGRKESSLLGHAATSWHVSVAKGSCGCDSSRRIQASTQIAIRYGKTAPCGVWDVKTNPVPQAAGMDRC